MTTSDQRALRPEVSVRGINRVFAVHLVLGALLVASRWSAMSRPDHLAAVAALGAIGATLAVRVVRLRAAGPSARCDAKLHDPTSAVALVVCWIALVNTTDAAYYQQFSLLPLLYITTPVVLGVVLAAIPSAISAAATLPDPQPLVIAISLFGWIGGALIAWWIRRISRRADEWRDLVTQLERTQADLAHIEHAAGAIEERRRFAAELHDTVAQSLTSIVLLCEAGAEPAGVRRIEDMARSALTDVRRLVADEHPAEPANGGLRDALTRLTAKPIYAGLRIDVLGDEIPGLPPLQAAALYSAAQEALHNIVKHAGASHAVVTVTRIGEVVALDVADEGCGFEPGSAPVAVAGEVGGTGIARLRERLATLGGTVAIETTSGRGTVMSVLIPFEAP